MRILVTGAGSGVGKASCALLTSRGHEVIAAARRPESLEGLPAALRITLDVADGSSVAAARRKIGSVDALVNNAAVHFGGPVEHVGIDRMHEMFETNVIGPVRLIQAFVPAMREAGFGVVVNISSVAGRVAQPLDGLYAASKHALEAVSEALYVELAHFGVRVVVIEPGFLSPAMKRRDDPSVPEEYAELSRQLEDVSARMASAGRPGPELVAEAVADAVEGAPGPLRRRVGEDAELILSARDSLGDEDFETAMREVAGLTW